MIRSLTVLSTISLLALTACGSDDPGPDPFVEPTGWWRSSVVYQVYVRSFLDSDADGIGDLDGLVDNFDYINDGDPATDTDLGADALWLMPITPSPSDHGYDFTDYRGVRADYGGMAAYERFIAEADARGMKVIFDLALNHSSNEHPWFLSAQEGPDAEFRDYYLWRDEKPVWRKPWDSHSGQLWHDGQNGDFYYGIFSELLPDLNLSNPAVEQEMLDVIRYWADRGVDGFRIDAARHLFETDSGRLSDVDENHVFMKRLRTAVEAEYPEVLLIAEAWTTARTLADYYGEGDQYHMAYSFDVADAIKNSVRAGDASQLTDTLRQAETFFVDRGFEAPFLSNHDQDRVLKTLERDTDKGRVAAAILFALPGTPFVYYGEELGMVGGIGALDNDKRTPMPWTSEEPTFGFTTADEMWWRTHEDSSLNVAAQRGVDGSMWTLYRDLIGLRFDNEALLQGASRLLEIDGPSGIVALERSRNGNRVAFVANLGDASADATITVNGAPTVLLSEGDSAVSGGTSLALTLESRGWAFIQLD